MDIKIFTDNIEGQALNQCYEIAKTPAFEHAKIRIMPDVHAGKGCVIGFTARDWDSIIANVVGVDIGCGMLVAQVEAKDFDLAELDHVINERVPAGFEIHEKARTRFKDLEKLRAPVDVMSAYRSIGSLGGGEMLATGIVKAIRS